MGVTLFFLSTIVLIPFAGLFLRVAEVCWHSPALTADNTQDMPDLVDRLKRHEDPVSALLWERFSDSTRQQITAAPDNAAPEVRGVVLAELNRILGETSLYDSNRFAEITFAPKAKWLLRYQVSSAWLNRTLLEDSFPSSINKKTSWLDLWLLATNERAMAAYQLTFGASVVAASINAVFGTILAWVLVRYHFPAQTVYRCAGGFSLCAADGGGRVDAGQPFCAERLAWQVLVPLGIKGAFTPLGVVIALTFVGTAVRGADACSRCLKTRTRGGRSRGDAWRGPAAHFLSA